jgi:hypothetical protein
MLISIIPEENMLEDEVNTILSVPPMIDGVFDVTFAELPRHIVVPGPTTKSDDVAVPMPPAIVTVLFNAARLANWNGPET